MFLSHSRYNGYCCYNFKGWAAMKMDPSSEFKIEIQFEERRLQKKDSHPQDSLLSTQASLETAS